MRIISNYRDYYDNIMGFGIDPKLVYVRNEQIIEYQQTYRWRRDIKNQDIRKNLSKLDYILHSIPNDQEVDYAVIAFCGQIYPCIIFNKKGYYNFDKFKIAIKEGIHWDAYDFTSRKELLNRLETRKTRRYSHSLNNHSWNKFLQDSDFTISESVHRYWKTPILLRTLHELILNPRLNKYNFQSVIDPWTAWQTLSMYIGNNMVNQMDPIVNISDKLKAESKGFDKWSFRRHKSESKKNRR